MAILPVSWAPSRRGFRGRQIGNGLCVRFAIQISVPPVRVLQVWNFQNPVLRIVNPPTVKQAFTRQATIRRISRVANATRFEQVPGRGKDPSQPAGAARDDKHF